MALTAPLRLGGRGWRPGVLGRVLSTAPTKPTPRLDLRGIYPPLATPFMAQGGVDYARLEDNLRLYAQVPFRGERGAGGTARLGQLQCGAGTGSAPPVLPPSGQGRMAEPRHRGAPAVEPGVAPRSPREAEPARSWGPWRGPGKAGCACAPGGCWRRRAGGSEVLDLVSRRATATCPGRCPARGGGGVHSWALAMAVALLVRQPKDAASAGLCSSVGSRKGAEGEAAPPSSGMAYRLHTRVCTRCPARLPGPLQERRPSRPRPRSTTSCARVCPAAPSLGWARSTLGRGSSAHLWAHVSGQRHGAGTQGVWAVGRVLAGAGGCPPPCP